MATAKKAAAKKTTAIVPWNEKFANYAKAGKDQLTSIGSGGLGVSFGRGSITVGGTAVKGGKLTCVIVGYCAHNKWYKNKYDPKDKQPPGCYAFAVITDDPEMRPHEKASDPQCVTTCNDCDNNAWGTAENGRGKACANTVRLGLFVAKDIEEASSISTADLATAGVSPTNLKNWKKYVDELDEQYGRPTWAVVTEISSHDDSEQQIRLEFRMEEIIEDDATLVALEKRFLKVQDALQVPYPEPTEKAPAARGGKKAVPAKKSTVGGAAKFSAAAARGKK